MELRLLNPIITIVINDISKIVTISSEKSGTSVTTSLVGSDISSIILTSATGAVSGRNMIIGDIVVTQL